MAAVFYFPLIGTPTAEGNQLSFFTAGTDSPLDVWTDSDLSLPFAQPIVLNSAGEADGPIYVSPSPAYKVVYVDSSGVSIPGYPVDFVSPSTIVNVMTTAIVTLTNAQIKALPTTPITLVAAPASGLRVKLLGATIRADFTAGAYTNVNTTIAWLQIQTPNANRLTVPIVNDSSTATDITQLTTFLNAAQTRVVDLNVPYVGAYSTASGSGTFEWPQSTIGTALTDVNGTAVQIAIENNGSGALTGGNAANSLTVVLYYSLESVL